MNVLSLFDGMSCGQIAIKRLGLPITNYYASEVDKSAIKISSTKFPKMKHLGNVMCVDISKLEPIDLLIGGSPCTDLSIIGKQQGLITKDKIEITTLEQYLELKENGMEFEGQSFLFWEYLRILKEIQKYNPNVKFLLENVVMSKKWEKIFSKNLGCEPITINSSLVSAHNRVRLYWTNISDEIEQPIDKQIELKDILEKTLDWNKASIVGRRMTNNGIRQDNNRDLKIYQCLEVKKTNTNKSNCLTTVSKDNVLTPYPPGRHFGVYINKLEYRNYTIKEVCRLQTIDDDYFYDENNKLIVSESQIKRMCGNGWTVDVIVYILSYLFKNN